MDGDDFTESNRQARALYLEKQLREARGQARGNGHDKEARTPAPVNLWFDAEGWSEAELPRRDWVVPRFAMRRTVTLIGGQPGVGKSNIEVAWGTAAALGMNFGAFEPPAPIRVMIYNVEDDQDEQRRRISASLRFFDRLPRDLADRMLRCGPEDVGTLVEHDTADNTFLETGAWLALEARIIAFKPDILFLDPLRELHTAQENDNTALRQVIAKLRTLARHHNCAVVLIHHFRKGGVAGDMDAFAGAASIVGAVRLAFTLTTMTTEEADEGSVMEDMRRSYIRLDSAKANYAPNGLADWYHLDGVELDNGELVGRAIPWAMSRRPGVAAPDAIEALRLDLHKGTSFGEPYTTRTGSNEPRSWAALCDHHGITSKKERDSAWRALQRLGYMLHPYRGASRHVRHGIRSPDGKPAANWLSVNLRVVEDDE